MEIGKEKQFRSFSETPTFQAKSFIKWRNKWTSPRTTISSKAEAKDVIITIMTVCRGSKLSRLATVLRVRIYWFIFALTHHRLSRHKTLQSIDNFNESRTKCETQINEKMQNQKLKRLHSRCGQRRWKLVSVDLPSLLTCIEQVN